MGKSPVNGGFPHEGSIMQNFEVFCCLDRTTYQEVTSGSPPHKRPLNHRFFSWRIPTSRYLSPSRTRSVSMSWYKTAVTPLLTHWSYCSLTLNHRCFSWRILTSRCLPPSCRGCHTLFHWGRTRGGNPQCRSRLRRNYNAHRRIRPPVILFQLCGKGKIPQMIRILFGDGTYLLVLLSCT